MSTLPSSTPHSRGQRAIARLFATITAGALISASLPLVAPAEAAYPTLSAHQLNADTVGYYATTKAAIDPAASATHAATRTVVKVTDFGADPTGARDSAKAVNDAILHAKSLKVPTTITFPKGTYQMYPEAAPKRELYVSNTMGADQGPDKIKTIGILIEDMSDVVIDGQDSTLLYHGRQTQMASIRSHNVSFINFDTDFVAPNTVDITILETGVTNGKGYTIVQVPPGTNYSISGATATFQGEKSPTTGQPYWSLGPQITTQWQNQIRDLASGRVWRSGLPLWNNSESVQPMDRNRLRITYTTPTAPTQTGQVYEIRDGWRNTPAVFVWESSNTNLVNLSMHYLHGFGLVAQLTRNVVVDRIAFHSNPGTWRQTSGFADYLQMSGVAGKVQITNSIFDNPHDDPINVHGTYMDVSAYTAGSNQVQLTFREPQTAGFPQFYPGNRVRFVDKATMLPVAGEYTVTAVDGPTGRDTSHDLKTMTVTFDRALPSNITVGNFVAENMTYSPEVYIAGNTFKSVPTRGILVTTPGKVLIERNLFDQMSMASIYVAGDAQSWYESGAIADLTIRNNVFERPTSNNSTIWFDPTNSRFDSTRGVHSNITIEANKFALLPDASAVHGKSVANLTFTKNWLTTYRPTTPATTTNTKALFSFAGGQSFTFSDNEYDPGLNRRVNLSNGATGFSSNDGVLIGQDNLVPVNGGNATLAGGMSWVRERGDAWLAHDPYSVSLKSGLGQNWASNNNLSNLLVKTPTTSAGFSSVTVQVSGATASSYEQAGPQFYLNDDNYVALERKHAGGRPVLALVTEAGGSANESTAIPAPANSDVWLRIQRSGNQFTGSYSLDGTTYTTIGTITNAAVTASAKAGVSAGGPSDTNRRFRFTDLVIDGTRTPFFSQVSSPPPGGAPLSSGLGWVRERSDAWFTDDLSSVWLRSGYGQNWAGNNNAINMLLKNPTTSAGIQSVTVKVSGATTSSYEQAGPVFYTNDDNYLALERKHAGGQPVIALVSETGGVGNESTKIAAPKNVDVWLRIQRSGTQFTGSYSLDGANFTTIGTVSNSSVATTARVGVSAGGPSDAQRAFQFSELTLDGNRQQLFTSLPSSNSAPLRAALAPVSWSGVAFGAPASPLAWYARTDHLTTSVTAIINPVDASTQVRVTVNEVQTARGADGSVRVALQGGPNVVEIRTWDGSGYGQIYRYVILSDQTGKVA